MWDGLPLDLDIEQVFSSLQDKADEFARPWSGTELQLTDVEVQWLRDWFRTVPPQGNGQVLEGIGFDELGERA